MVEKQPNYASFDSTNSRAGTSMRSNLVTGLERAKALLDSEGPDANLAVDRLVSLKRRLLGNHLQVAILGQFKRGKSTFINALLGAPILPVAVIPLTAVAIFVSWGAGPIARVRFRGDRAPKELRSADVHSIQVFLSRFVAEEHNPKNYLGVERVELQYPSPILSDGTTLIDTPGVGSSHQHNTDAAIQILPECDAAIFIISADPPITEIELSYLEKIRAKATRVFFVLNKLDYLASAEQRTAIDFLRKVLSEHLLLEQSNTIFGISARDALAAKQNNDRRELERSGLFRLEKELLPRLVVQKTQLLQKAIQRKAVAILSQEIERSELSAKALALPIDELTSKASAFEKALRAIEEQHRTICDLLEGDKRRLIDFLESQINKLREDASSRCADLAEESVSGDNPGAWEQQARTPISQTLTEIFEIARERLRREFTDETAKTLALHQVQLDGLIDSVHQTAGQIFEVSFSPQGNQDSFEFGEDPYWVTESTTTSLLPDTGQFIDHLVPLRRRRARLYGRIKQQTNELITRNAENLRWAILRGINEVVLRAQQHFDEQISWATAATKGVVEDALALRNSKSLQAEERITNLGHLIHKLRNIREAIAAALNDSAALEHSGASDNVNLSGDGVPL